MGMNSIAFYPEEGKFDFSTLKRGNVVRIDNGESKVFLDGTCGLRIEDLDSIHAYPISFDKLKKIDEMVANEELSSDECWACHRKKTEPGVRLSTCGRCRFALYCCQECQKQDWTKHKVSCKGKGQVYVLRSFIRYCLITSIDMANYKHITDVTRATYRTTVMG